MNILVVGASGFVGSHLIAKLQKTNHNLVCISQNSRKNQTRLQWIKINLEKPDYSKLKKINFDFVYFLAAQTSIYEAKDNPEKNLKINTLSLVSLIEHFRKTKQRPFILFTSTVSISGLNLYKNKKIPDNPLTFYDVSKKSTELYLKEYIRQSYVNGCIFRLANIIGINTSDQKKDRGVIFSIIKKISKNETITIWGDGKYYRDYLYIDDLVNLLLLSLKKYQNMNNQIFNIGSGSSITLKSAFKKILRKSAQLFNSTSQITYDKEPANLEIIEKRSAFINIDPIKKATGWKIQNNFDDSIDKIINQIRK